MSDTLTVTTTGEATTLSFGTDPDDPTRATDERPVYLDRTLVLIGCGAAKRDPDDPTDLHLAATPTGEEPPKWRAKDLYTSTYFQLKREFAENVTQWARGYDGSPYSIISAEHAVVPCNQKLQKYDTSIDDIGDDPTNPDHRVDNRFDRRRPDGQEIVTEMDQWAAQVAYTLCKWVSNFRPRRARPWDNDATELLLLAGKDYVEPLRERGVFEYGISRMTGDPNTGVKFPLDVRCLFDEIDAGGIGDQMGWLSSAISEIENAGSDPETAEQQTLC